MPVCCRWVVELEDASDLDFQLLFRCKHSGQVPSPMYVSNVVSTGGILRRRLGKCSRSHSRLQAP